MPTLGPNLNPVKTKGLLSSKPNMSAINPQAFVPTTWAIEAPPLAIGRL